tara:strand:+ start:96 stop:479 length:384 start_codon:yes stop_codon:yes gene_type:complete
MKILIKDDLVDLEAPIYASEEQKNKIIAFFKDKFPNLSTKDVVEPDREFGEKDIKLQHKWEAKDYLNLFSTKSNEELGDELGLGTGMGPQVKRGTFIMAFLKWKNKKGENLPITEELIKEFLEEVEF